VIVAGLGFRTAAGVDSLRDALTRAASRRRVDLIATAADKAAAPAFRALADELGVPPVGIPAASLEAQPTQTRSAAALAARRTGSVAEAAALAAAGPGARLVVPRRISADGLATCALAVAAADCGDGR
jgi:cobalt-precorrin 5A hydrolase